MARSSLRLALTALLFLLCACSPYALPPAPRFELPRQVSELGLYADLRAGAVRDDVRPYAPSFALWSDGATKRRWIRLPPGTKIDTTDLDVWRFPVGTELFKEFSIAGRRIETRILRKVTPDDDGWAAMSYAWNLAQTEAIAAPEGVKDALGTKLDIPSSRACIGCHGGRPERVLGFGAIQLAHAPKLGDHNGDRELTLDRLAAEHALTVPPTGPIVVPGSATEVAAVGYLHANCGHCHNGGRPADARYLRPPPHIDFGLRVADLGDVTSTRAFATARRYAMGANPAQSHLIVQRMTREGSYMRRMPPIATELVDDTGVALVSAWLNGVTR